MHRKDARTEVFESAAAKEAQTKISFWPCQIGARPWIGDMTVFARSWRTRDISEPKVLEVRLTDPVPWSAQ